MRSSHVLTAGVSAFVSSAITVAVFIWVSSPVDNPQNVHAQSTSSTSEKYVTRLDRDTVAIPGAPASDGTFDHVRTLADTLAFEADFDQTVAIHLLLANADEELVLDLLQQAESISPPSQKEAAFSIIYSKYAAIDPERALANAEGLSPTLHNRVLMNIFHEWARNDLESALTGADSLEGNRRQTAGYVILTSRDDLAPTRREEIAKRFNLQRQLASLNRQSWLAGALEDPRSAWQESLVSTDGDLNNMGVRSAIAEAWIKQEGILVLNEMISTLPDQHDKEELISDLLYPLVGADPDATLEFLSRLGNSKDVGYLKHRVFDIWSRRDPEAAMERLVSMDFHNKGGTIDMVLYHWGRADPRELLEVADELPQTWINLAKSSAIKTLARSSREEAFLHLDGMRDSTQKFRLEYELAKDWSHDEPRAALQWFLSLDRDKYDLRHRRAGDLMESYAHGDPVAALQLASRYTGRLGESLVEGIFETLVDTDHQHALRYLSRVNQKQKRVAVERIGLAMVRDDLNPIGALNLRAQLEKEDQSRYERSILNRTISYGRSRNALLSSFDAIPSRELKVFAASRLLQTNEYEKFLTEQDRQRLYGVLNEVERGKLESELQTLRRATDLYSQ